MIVFIEGPDGSGKSTLIDKLYKDGFPIFKHLAKDKINWFTILKSTNECEMTLISNRSPMTDIIYRSYDDKILTDLNLVQFLHLIEKGNIKFIYCNTETAYEDCKQRGTHYGSAEDFFKHFSISQSYSSLFLIIKNEYNNIVKRYDWHKDNYDDILKFIKGE